MSAAALRRLDALVDRLAALILEDGPREEIVSTLRAIDSLVGAAVEAAA